MDLTDLRLVSRHEHPVRASETRSVAAELGTALPDDYVDLVERYGQGTTCDHVRVYVPGELVRRTAEWRERITEYWFWDTDGAGVSAQTLQTRGVVIADTIDGDEVCFVLGAPQRTYLLPRHSDDAIAFDGGLVPVVEWVLGHFSEPPLPIFESWTGRRDLEWWGHGDDGAAVGADLLALGLHDTVRTGEHHLQLLVPSLGASLHVVSGRGARVYGSYDADAPAAELDLVLGVLARHGLKRLQA